MNSSYVIVNVPFKGHASVTFVQLTSRLAKNRQK
jgi:hypothetical protein